MLPGNASRLPKPVRLRISAARKPTPNAYHGPSRMPATTLTMCCTGAHLLPNTGKDNRLPTTAMATRRPARVRRMTRLRFI